MNRFATNELEFHPNYFTLRIKLNLMSTNEIVAQCNENTTTSPDGITVFTEGCEVAWKNLTAGDATIQPRFCSNNNMRLVGVNARSKRFTFGFNTLTVDDKEPERASLFLLVLFLLALFCGIGEEAAFGEPSCAFSSVMEARL